MNTLSWMIYLAGVCGNAQTVCFVAILALLVITAVSLGLSREYDPSEHGEKTAAHLRRARYAGYAVVCCAFGIVIFPSKDTVYAIAASEMGEKVLQTETAGKATRALNAWLDKQIEGEPK